MRVQTIWFALILGWVHAAGASEPAGSAEPLPAPLSLSTPGGLTADEVARRAEATGLNIKARGRALAAAEAGLAQALAAFLPKMTLTAQYTRLSSYQQPALQTLPAGALNAISTDPRVAANPAAQALAEDIIQAYDNAAMVGSRFPLLLNQYLAQASLIVPISDYVLRLSWQYAAASHSVQAAEFEQRAARATTRANARVLYYTWLRAIAQVIIASRSLDQAQQHLGDVERHFRAGIVPKADVSRVRAQVANAELVLQAGRNVADLREEQIKLVMHDDSSAHYVPGEELSLDPGSPSVSDTVKSLQEEAIANRLEIRALDETAWSFVQQAKAAQAAGWPQLSLSGNLTTARPNPRIIPATDQFRTTWEVGAQLVWVPSDMPGANAVASQSRAKSEEVQFQKAELRDSVALEVFQAYQQIKEAAVAVETASTEIESAEETYTARRALFRSGRTTSADLTDAELVWARAQLDAINSQADLRIARVRLDHATGRDAN